MNHYLTEQQVQDEKFEKEFGYQELPKNDFTADLLKNYIDAIKSHLLSRDTALLEAFKKDVGEMVGEEIKELETWAKVSEDKQVKKEYIFGVFVLKKVLSALLKDYNLEK